MPKHHHIVIYKSRWHLFATICFVIVPFLFLWVFSSVAQIATGKLFLDVFVSFARLMAAYLVAVILAWVAAVAFFRGRGAAVALPLFDVLQSFPTFAALPIAVYFWGSSDTTVIFFLVITVIWPIFFSIISSLKLIKHDWEEAAEMSGLTGFNYLRFFILPISLPGLITGSIVGLGEGWEALVATEIIAGMKLGLGSFFGAYSTNVSITMFGILGFLILIFSMNKLLWLPLLESSHRRMEE